MITQTTPQIPTGTAATCPPIVQDLLTRMQAIGATLEADGDRLLVTEGATPLPPALLRALRTHKHALLAWLSGMPATRMAEAPEQPVTPAAAPAQQSDQLTALLEERSSVIEQMSTAQRVLRTLKPGSLPHGATQRHLDTLRERSAALRAQILALAEAQPDQTTDETTDQTQDETQPASAVAPVVDPVWMPPRWVMEPGSAARTGIVCGSQLFVWRSADPRRTGGLLGAPERVIDLTADLETTHSAGDSAGDASGAVPGADLGALADLMATLRLRAVWLIPAQGSAPGEMDSPIVRHWSRTNPAQLRQQSPRWLWHELSARGPAGNSPLLGGLGFRAADTDGQATGARRCIYAQFVQDSWAIADDCAALSADVLTRARVVASALALAEWSLGIQLWYSPAHSGLTLLRETLQQWSVRKISLDPLPEEWQERLRLVKASDVRWARPASLEEATASATWLAQLRLAQETQDAAGRGIPADMAALWVYDRNSSYVSSARVVPVGIPTATAAFVPGCMGVYRVNAAAPAGWDPRTPGLLRAGEGAGTYPLEVQSVWVWEPYLRLALQLGWSVQVLEGWYWPREQQHELLRLWHTRVWDARRSAEASKTQPGAVGLAGRLAVHLIKRLGVATIGRLMPRRGQAVMTTADALELGYPIEWELTDERGQFTGLAAASAPLGRQDMVHPEWWSPIIAGAGERLLAPICRQAPLTTLAAYIDSLYSLTPIPALAGEPLKVGGYRHNHTVLIPRDLLASGSYTEIVTAAAHALELDGLDGPATRDKTDEADQAAAPPAAPHWNAHTRKAALHG